MVVSSSIEAQKIQVDKFNDLLCYYLLIVMNKHARVDCFFRFIQL